MGCLAEVSKAKSKVRKKTLLLFKKHNFSVFFLPDSPFRERRRMERGRGSGRAHRSLSSAGVKTCHFSRGFLRPNPGRPDFGEPLRRNPWKISPLVAYLFCKQVFIARQRGPGPLRRRCVLRRDAPPFSRRSLPCRREVVFFSYFCYRLIASAGLKRAERIKKYGVCMTI